MVCSTGDEERYDLAFDDRCGDDVATGFNRCLINVLLFWLEDVLLMTFVDAIEEDCGGSGCCDSLGR